MTTLQSSHEIDVVSGRYIPLNMLYDTHRALKQAGVVFGKVVDGSNLFGHMTLPSGWRVIPKGTGSFWMVDENGRRRAEIFYTPSSNIHAPQASVFSVPRFTVMQDWNQHNKHNQVLCRVYDGERVVFESAVFSRIFCSEAEAASGFNLDNPSANAARKECTEWLDDRFPQWANHSAYWN